MKISHSTCNEDSCVDKMKTKIQMNSQDILWWPVLSLAFIFIQNTKFSTSVTNLQLTMIQKEFHPTYLRQASCFWSDAFLTYIYAAFIDVRARTTISSHVNFRNLVQI